MPAGSSSKNLSVIRVLYWLFVAAGVLVIYKVPSRAATPLPARTLDIVYLALLIASISELGFMKYFSFVAARSAARGTSDQQPQPIKLEPAAMPIMLAAFGVSPTIYGVLYHFLGGGANRSLALCLFSLLAYAVFCVLAPKSLSAGGSDAEGEPGRSS